jgi:hypothetical protein
MSFEEMERAMEFILQQQARTDAKLDRVVDENTRQFQAANARMDRLERNLTRMARLGVRWRSENRRWQEQHAKAISELDLKVAEIADKLNGLIAFADGWWRQQPNHPQ